VGFREEISFWSFFLAFSRNFVFGNSHAKHPRRSAWATRGRHSRRRLAPPNPSPARPSSSSPAGGGGQRRSHTTSARSQLVEPPHLSPVPCPKSRSAQGSSHGGGSRGALSCSWHEIPDRRRATPKTIAEAYSSPDADYWKEAVRSEMDSIMSNGT
jgi:hypothetical protein